MAQHTGNKLTKAPLINPKNMPNVMMAASLCAGVQYARIEMAMMKENIVWILYAPALSAMNPGRIRPNIDMALAIEMR